VRHDWVRPEAYWGGTRPVPAGPGPAPHARPDPSLVLRAAPTGVAGVGRDAPEIRRAWSGLQLPQLAGPNATAGRDRLPGERYLDLTDPVEADTGTTGFRHPRDRHPCNRRLGRAESPAAPALAEPASGGWRLGGDRRPGASNDDPRRGSSKLTLVKPSAPPLVLTVPNSYLVFDAGDAVSATQSFTGGCPPHHARAKLPSSLLSERATIGSTKSNGDAPR